MKETIQSKIIILRHGITEGNKKKWFYGSTDLPLLSEGKEDLRSLAESGIYPQLSDVTLFFTTGMKRTEETLSVLFGEREHEAIPELVELGFGEYECMAFDEIKDDPAFLSWGYDETGKVSLPGGESRDEFDERTKRGTEILLNRHLEFVAEASKDIASCEKCMTDTETPKATEHGAKTCKDAKTHQNRDTETNAIPTTVLVCHGGVINSIMNNVFPQERKSRWDWMTDPGCGYEINMEGARATSHRLIGTLATYYGEEEDNE